MNFLQGDAHDQRPRPGVVWRLLVIVGVIYFIQGIIEPTTYLPAQPLQTQLRAWRLSAEQVGHFFGIIGIAWAAKPLFGLLSDFLPIAGRRRWPYLIGSTALTAVAFAGLALWWQPSAGSSADIRRMGALLLAAGVGLALTDIAIDALAVETGQPLGITGQIQSIQWAALSVAGLLVGTLGGYVAERGLLGPLLQGSALLAAASTVAVICLVREPPQAGQPRAALGRAVEQLRSGRCVASLAAIAAFLFFWNFNPFSNNVLQSYMSEDLGYSEQLYGHLTSVQSAASAVACVAYAIYCRRLSLTGLVHGSIVAGIVSTLCYWLLREETSSAVLVSIVFGLTYQTGLLTQLDLAARICPTQSSGTTFAMLMAAGNAGLAAGVYLGGGWYDALAEHFHGSRHLAFHTLVGIGAVFTAGCWLLVPVLRWAAVK
jgi:Na+/melibiose symporter-like transporter